MQKTNKYGVKVKELKDYIQILILKALGSGPLSIGHLRLLWLTVLEYTFCLDIDEHRITQRINGTEAFSIFENSGLLISYVSISQKKKKQDVKQYAYISTQDMLLYWQW